MVGFNQDTKDKYKVIVEIKSSNPQMLIDLESATIETLPEFISKYQDDLAARNANLKAEKKQRDIFYTFIYHLGNINNQQSFDAFKAGFLKYSNNLFAASDKKDYLISSFNSVTSFADFQRFFDNLKTDYNVVNQDYLVRVSAVKAETSLLKQVSDINAAISVVKKQYDLADLQKSTNTFKSESGSFNFTLILSYLLFFITCATMLVFLLWHTFANLKSNMGLLIGVGALILLVVVGYFTASDELSAVAIKQQAEPNTVKWIGAGLFVAYAMFFGTIAVIVITMIINSLKKAK
jgi:hypothetical protein